jgi:hypothetical protein
MAASVAGALEESTEAILHEVARDDSARAFNTAETLDEISRWTYGQPYAMALPSGEAMVVYYAENARGTGVHWVRLSGLTGN